MMLTFKFIFDILICDDEVFMNYNFEKISTKLFIVGLLILAICVLLQRYMGEIVNEIPLVIKITISSIGWVLMVIGIIEKINKHK